MSEETKTIIEELVKATEGNDIAKAFLRGYKSGLDSVNTGRDDAADGSENLSLSQRS